jgi:hypothetical protein
MTTSSKAAQAVRIEAPDSTYKSLASLLASSASSASSHLELIPVNGLASSITHYLSTLPTKDAAQFAKLLASSNALWSQSTILQRSTLVYEATARSVFARINVIVAERKGSLGWSSRRNIVSWVRAIADATHLDAESLPDSCDKVPVSTVAILTGLVAGLQAAKAQKSQHDDRGLNVHYALDRGEDEWCIALAECLDALSERELPLNEWEAEFKKASVSIKQGNETSGVKTATLYLAAQVAPFISSKKIEALPTESLLNTLAATLLEIFKNSWVLDSIREDVSQNDQGQLRLQADSLTASRADAFAAHPLFPLMGPLSRMVSLALSSATRTTSPLQLRDLLLAEGSFMNRMQNLSHQWQSKWLSCRLAGATEAEIDPESKARTTQLWNVFKTLLFSYTMIFDALLEAIVDVCPSPTVTLQPNANSITTASGRWPYSTISNIPTSYLELTRSVLIVYSHLSWITATFGSSAFDAYRRVFHEALEVLSRDAQACVNLVDKLAPVDQGTTLQINSGRRAAVTFYFDVVEQSMAVLPDEMVVQVILPLAKDYLEHAEYQDSFESAHSAVLSIFATQKKVVCALTAYYVNHLLTSYPSNLKEEQLGYAFSTVINATSDKSDTVTWYSLEMLWKAIEEERSKPDLESARKSRELSYIYIAQLPNINLVLFRSMLFKIKQLILQEDAGSEERIAICEKVFQNLAGLDASTREDGLKWWLDERKTFGV